MHHMYHYKSRDLLFGLLVKCPHGNARAECPFERFRSDNLPEMKETADRALNIDLAECLIEYHDHCIENRADPSSQKEVPPFIHSEPS